MDPQINMDNVDELKNDVNEKHQDITQQPENAITVRKATKSYCKNQPSILDNLNMTVPRGCIYALLGASGCGKTTLLSCIVGIRKLEQGEIRVFGSKPGSKNSGVPGPKVGYMPQEIALIEEFSTIGAFYYFGRINGLDNNDIDEGYEYFSKLLNLPSKNHLIKNMSGGQQRRVSLAVSLLHKPELLILDEPTVGIDPVLREEIWNFLVKISSENKTAIVITTHYIDEAKHAGRIGLMRHGKLLAETSPQKLLTKFQCPTLEEVFMILSQKQENTEDKTIPVEEVDSLSDDLFEEKNIELPPNSKNNCKSEQKQTGRIFQALMVKNLIQFVRHPGAIPFAVLMPLVQCLLFFPAIGDHPKGLVMAVVNDEAGNCNNGKYLGEVIFDPNAGICDYKDLSCRFLNGFNEPVMNKKFFDTIEEATMAVQRGKAWGSMYFPKNFSRALQFRRDNPRDVLNETLVEGEIQTVLDMSNQQIGIFLKKELYDRFFHIYGDVFSECKYSRRSQMLPITFEEPIFGKMNEKWTYFIGPAFSLTLIFLLSAAYSTLIIITDKTQGIWDRSIVQGVQTPWILFCHIITQFIIVVIQVTVVMASSILIFNLPCRGNIFLAIFVLLLTGFLGMCFGFFISTICTSLMIASFMMLGFAFPTFLLSGAIWPIEGIPKIIRWISLMLPMAMPCGALRSILSKGSNIDVPEVYGGILVLLGWTMLFIILCLIGVRVKPT